jgi:hypothetical protein
MGTEPTLREEINPEMLREDGVSLKKFLTNH